ncbi:MAG TPA: SigE family RNA polymerase sigma factor [Nocardioides sp.]|uniref:SigE family RNA polymerase sigma factor n=1 Tax=Nocardioides sp. TaxID=35761 RepID=UPI002E352BC3|nr:SigE family RNA polymerase sigma factor [Nocardioides sp.]HEX3932245.1 SigE family RNA polymerase sigma factor [Nocardioides sp.]
MSQTPGPGRTMASHLVPPRQQDFESWLVSREGALQRTAHLLTGDVHAAQDLVQATLTKLYRRWDRVQRVQNIDAYARKALVNEFRTAWRRPVRRMEQVVEAVPDRPGPDSPAYDGEREAVWRFVRSLPPRQRTVLVLRFYQQLSEAEVAEVMGISVGTVKSQSSRAIASLRAALPDHPEIAGEESSP